MMFIFNLHYCISSSQTVFTHNAIRIYFMVVDERTNIVQLFEVPSTVHKDFQLFTGE